MPKVHVDQGNLFGGCGQVTEVQIAVSAGVALVDCYLKCDSCGGVSGQLHLPATVMVDKARALWFAKREAGWKQECPDCDRRRECA